MCLYTESNQNGNNQGGIKKKEFLNTRFGIEIEFTGISREEAADVLKDTLGVHEYTHVRSYDART